MTNPFNVIASAVGVRKIHLHSVDSTQTYAKSLLFSPSFDKNSPYVISADIQTEAYGCRGSKWISIQDNFHVTYIIPIPTQKTVCQDFIHNIEPYQLTKCVTTAVWKVLANYGIMTTIKWKNDILLMNRKICGTLIEKIDHEQTFYLIGVGINIAHAPDDNNAGSIKQIYPNFRYDLSSIAEDILMNIMLKLSQKKAQANLNIHTEYASNLAYLGSHVMFHKNYASQLDGIFVGIDEKFAPILEIGNYRIKIPVNYKMQYKAFDYFQ